MRPQCQTLRVSLLTILTVGLLALPCAAQAGQAAVPPVPLSQLVPSDALVPVTCFAEGTDSALVAYYEERQPTGTPGLVTSLENALAGLDHFQFPDSARWSATATDGGGLGQGDPTTLTWSIVPDGTSIFGYNGEPTAPSNLRARLNQIYGSQAVWLPLFEQVFDRWSELTGVSYVMTVDDGSPWTSTNIAAGQIGVRGDVRISGHFIDGNSGVLAYNFFPDFGDMVIDTGDNVLNNTGGNSLIFRNILAHEHGHGLGMSHVCPINQTKLMEPFLTTAFDGPQFDDILAGNRGYGDDLELNDSPGLAFDLGSFGSGSGVSVADISVDDNSDPDYYEFTVGNGAAVSVTVTPQGGTYLSGPQNSNGSCSAGTNYDAGDNQNLVLRILDTNGTTTLATANNTGAGGSESLTGVNLPGSGSYFVQVTGGSNEAQMYEMSLDVSGSSGGALQFGNERSDEVIRTVSLSGFSTPRVVAGPPSFAGAQPVTVRLRNVGSGSFQHDIQEWDYLDGAHAIEALGYLALDDGPQNLGSLAAEAGSVNIEENWVTVSFSQSFSSAPVVLAQVSSFAGSQAVETRVRNVTASSFQIRLQEEEGNDDDHAVERVDWIAVQTGTSTFNGVKVAVGRTGNSVTHNWSTVSFSAVTNPTLVAEMQTFDGPDAAALRHRNLSSSSFEVKVEEEQSADTETNHTTEVVGWLVIGTP